MTISTRFVTALAFSIATLTAASSAHATYGGSGGYQQEERENNNSCAYQNDCFGRCGRACSTYFGTMTTTQCRNHDQCMKDNMCAGKTSNQAQLACLGGSRGLGKAVWSVVQYHWDNYAKKAKSSKTSSWATVAP